MIKCRVCGAEESDQFPYTTWGICYGHIADKIHTPAMKPLLPLIEDIAAENADTELCGRNVK
jgi:transcription initiation factor IIE alpha subunit